MTCLIKHLDNFTFLLLQCAECKGRVKKQGTVGKQLISLIGLLMFPKLSSK